MKNTEKKKKIILLISVSFTSFRLTSGDLDSNKEEGRDMLSSGLVCSALEDLLFFSIAKQYYKYRSIGTYEISDGCSEKSFPQSTTSEFFFFYTHLLLMMFLSACFAILICIDE